MRTKVKNFHRKAVEKLDLFDLYAKITLDTGEYEEQLSGAGEKISAFADKLKNGLATAAKVGAAALTAASGAVVALTKSVVENYGEYEQLVGGVETLFGAGGKSLEEYAASVGKTVDEVRGTYDSLMAAQQTVMDNAANAYKTAGMSANEYMETVTSFSASLLQSMGGDTQAAAEKADLAITDMADNANKMGSSIESIQNAYSGFAKQNYTMLDNLKLGYGGTKAEMERLLADAEKLSGIKYDISSYADIVDAIHVVQGEMGISGRTAEEVAEIYAKTGRVVSEQLGTTALEASTTIQGSVASVKAAWENLITGLGDKDADLEMLIGNLVESAKTAAGNLIPVITTALSGMGEAIAQLAPVLAAELPGLVSSVLPSVVSAGAQLLVGLATGLVSALPELVSAIPGIITSLVEALSTSLPALQEAGGELLDMLGNGILSAVPALVADLPTIITAILEFMEENLPKWTEAGFDFIRELAFGIISAIPELIAKLPELIKQMADYISSELPTFLGKGAELVSMLLVGIIGAIPSILESIPDVIFAIVEALISMVPTVLEAGLKIGEGIIQGIWEGIEKLASWLTDMISDFINGIVDGIKDLLGIHSPSRVFAGIGGNMALGLGDGWDAEYGAVKRGITDGLDFGEATVSTGASGGLGGLGEAGAQSKGGDIVINLTAEMDAAVVARKTYRYNQREGNLRGLSLVEVHG